MAKPVTSQIINELPPKGWAGIHSPRYHAVENAAKRGVFACAAVGVGWHTAEQLAAWAVAHRAEVVLMTWTDAAPAWPRARNTPKPSRRRGRAA